MKRNQWEQLKTKSAAELRKLMHEHRTALWTLTIDLKAGKGKNVKEINRIKKDIARIMTLLGNEL